MSRTPRTVAVPGEPTLTPADPVDTSMAAAAEEIDSKPVAVEPTAADHVNEEVEALRAQVAAMQAQLAQAQAAQPVGMKSVNASHIKGVTLTERGYIVPDTFGQPVRKA